MDDDSYEIVFFHDPAHSEAYVLKLLSECLPNVSETKAMNLYLIAYTNKKCVVFRGHIEHAEHFFEKMNNYPYEYEEGTGYLLGLTLEMIDPKGKKVEL